MQTFGSIIPGATMLARLLPEGTARAGKQRREAVQEAKLSREARQRLKVIHWHEEHGRNGTGTAGRFGYSRATIHTWLKRYKARGPAGLEARSHRPHQPRRSTWSQEMELQVLRLREQYPRWGKDKLVVLLRREGRQVSTSMVGRILKRLKDTRQLVEALPEPTRRRKDLKPRPYAIRKPRGYFAREPGEMVEVDTVDLRPLPGVVLKHFTARDVVSRWDVLGVYGRATANTASLFLEDLLARTPFEVKAIQVDGGSEYKAQFEAACRDKGILLFVLPPRSPKLNGSVERGNRTHRDEFYEVYDLEWTVQGVRPDLLWWEGVYNTIRPYVALGYLTPLEYITQWRQGRPGKEVVYSIT
jgi:transposase InsO family protein